MSAFRAILAREISLAIRTGGAGLALSFFVLTIALLPLAVGAEPGMLRRLDPGFVWLAALLAQLLTLERLVQADLEDGSLDLLLGAAIPLELAFVAKALAHWLSVGLPLTLLSLLAALLLGLDGAGAARLLLSLLIGLPGLSAIGATISALTAGVRRGSLLLALLVLPLAVPFLIFGPAAASERGLASFPVPRCAQRFLARPFPPARTERAALPDRVSALPQRPAAAKPRLMWRHANPGRFLALSGRLLPWTAAATAVLFGSGLALALILSPADYQQGEAVRIMYVHVPAAWIAMAAYVVMAGASLVALVWRHALADVAAEAAAPLGAAFTAIALGTGMLWGKPMWGTYWVWDARLTSVLVLLFLYLGAMAIREAHEDRARGARAAQILALLGVVNLPIIKFSVDWWNTLHQGESVFRADGPSIAAQMLWPLGLMALAYTLLFGTLLMLRIRTMIFRQQVRAASARKASTAEIREAAHA